MVDNKRPKEFKVYVEGWNGKDDPHTVQGIDEKHAVEQFVQNNFSNLDYPTEQEVYVIHEDGTICGWAVEVESCPQFHGRRL